MKTIKSVIPRVAGFFLIMLVITSVIYPMAVTGISQLFFKEQANGSIIEGADGKKYGSALLAQQFTGNEYLWGRIMNVDTQTYANDDGETLMYAGASNKSPAGEEMQQMVTERVERIQKAHPDKAGEPIPVDLVTCSGSGLDPEISPAAAKYQADRIADARGISGEEVREVIEKYTTGRFLGVFGEPRVNVLKVNLALDGLLS